MVCHYSKTELTPGKVVNLPWLAKGGRIKYRNAVVVKSKYEVAVTKYEIATGNC